MRKISKLPKVKKELKDAHTEFIDLKYPALLGRLHHITIPFERFDRAISDGIGVDGSSLPGYKGVERGDMLLFPDLETLFFDPLFEHKTASFLCSVHSPDTLIPFERDPRDIAKKAVIYLKKELNTQAFFQPELEFYLFEQSGNGEFQIPSYKDIGQRNAYHIGPPADRYYNLRNNFVKTLSTCGIKSKYHHHEVGPRGQLEIELIFERLPKCADNIFLGKYFITCLAQKYNKCATFMPKPIFGEPGSGLHLHQYLGKERRSLFYSPHNKSGLSDLCLNYIAGILHHSCALCAFTNPSTNSYKRLIPGFEAPTYADFGIGNRNSSIRIPLYIRNKRLIDIEYRIPDATANPYLAISAILLAGIDGIKNKLKPDKKEKLPMSSYEAINALKKDYAFLLSGNVFNRNLIETWIELKTREFEEIHRRPHPYEFTLYFS